ncbi:MAG: hypothetical protein IJ666_03410 [Ruminococcus sp.]|nr:hypothetical protein [Ruminococcus sp.]
MFRKLSAALVLLILITGCGEKVDLYDSTPPSMFAGESSRADSSEKKEDSLFGDDYDKTENPDNQGINIIPVDNGGAEISAGLQMPVSGFWRDSLSEQDKASYDNIYNTLMSGNIDVKFDVKYTAEEIEHIYQCFSEDHPEIFWLTKGYLITYDDTSSGLSLCFVNDIDSGNLAEYRTRFEEEAQNILSRLPQDASLYEQILFIHDYIVRHTKYASDYVSIPYEDSHMYYSAYGCLVQHYCVCSGYTKAFQYLMHEIGVPCGSVSGFATRNGEAHKWNYVKYEGEYYWIDVTWDDPVDYSGDPIDTSEVAHTYFFITTDELLHNHVIGNKDTLGEDNLFVPECTATEYNYMRHSGNYMESYSF